MLLKKQILNISNFIHCSCDFEEISIDLTMATVEVSLKSELKFKVFLGKSGSLVMYDRICYNTGPK